MFKKRFLTKFQYYVVMYEYLCITIQSQLITGLHRNHNYIA